MPASSHFTLPPTPPHYVQEISLSASGLVRITDVSDDVINSALDALLHNAVSRLGKAAFDPIAEGRLSAACNLARVRDFQ